MLYKVALATLASAALGGLAVEGLHAAAPPPAYVIAEVDVHNADAYAKEVGPNFGPIIKAHGGHLLATAGAAGTGKVMALIGEAPNRVAVVQFDNMTALQSFGMIRRS